MSDHSKYYVTNFYCFHELTDLPLWEADLFKVARTFDLMGLVILSTEGLNATVSATHAQAIADFKTWLEARLSRTLTFKDSQSDRPLFREFKVKVRPEIVTLGAPGLIPERTGDESYLSPAEWDRTLKSDTDFVLIDTRNRYETRIGSFAKAVDPMIDQFTEFPDVVESKLKIAKDQKVLIFCTGGIRCEKGILDLKNRGYEKVYQLDGGILKYLEEFPNQEFQGECFVFDNRVAVDQNLKPTERYKLCPHCGQPADRKIACARCDTEAIICEECANIPVKLETCSKNCAHHYGVRPGVKGERQAPVVGSKSLKS